MKKIMCQNCKTKTAVLDLNTRIAKCHICGKESEEEKHEIIGNYKITQGINEKNIRFIEIKLFEDQFKIEDAGMKKKLIIFEDD